MRYWINPENQSYELSDDDLTQIGFIEVTERPSPYSEVYHWNAEDQQWVIDSVSLAQAIAARRYEVETGGVYYNNRHIDTSDRSKTLLMMTRARCENVAGPFMINWKICESEYLTLSATDFMTLSGKVCDFIGQCFDSEAALLDRSIRLDFSVEELNTSWPSNIITL